MRNEKTYNGYTNYETWLVAIQIDNEQGTSEYWRNTAQELVEQNEESNVNDCSPTTINEFAEQLKDDFEVHAPELEGFWADLLNAALSEVDWYDVAEGILSGCKPFVNEEVA